MSVAYVLIASVMRVDRHENGDIDIVCGIASHEVVNEPGDAIAQLKRKCKERGLIVGAVLAGEQLVTGKAHSQIKAGDGFTVQLKSEPVLRIHKNG